MQSTEKKTLNYQQLMKTMPVHHSDMGCEKRKCDDMQQRLEDVYKFSRLTVKNVN